MRSGARNQFQLIVSVTRSSRLDASSFDSEFTRSGDGIFAYVLMKMHDANIWYLLTSSDRENVSKTPHSRANREELSTSTLTRGMKALDVPRVKFAVTHFVVEMIQRCIRLVEQTDGISYDVFISSY